MADESWEDMITAAADRFNVAPEGTFEFRIEDAESTVFSSGNPGIKVKLKIANGPEAGKSIKTVNVVRSPKAAGLFLDHLAAVGISADTLMQAKPTLDQIAKIMPGKHVSGTVKHKEYQGRTQAELQWNMKPPAGGAVPVTAFPAVSDAEALGYGSGDAVATDDDAGF